MNAGFIMQQIDLYLSAKNLASCWLGLAKPVKQEQDNKNGLEFVIMLAFGNSTESIHRKETSEFNRKSLSDISNVFGIDSDELLEPVRLAPSASNSQPWFFSGTIGQIFVSREKLNFLRAPLYGRMNQVDIGIALCHMWLSLKHQGKCCAFDFNPDAAPAGYEFMAKANIGG
jgi:nitroreductase